MNQLLFNTERQRRAGSYKPRQNYNREISKSNIGSEFYFIF